MNIPRYPAIIYANTDINPKTKEKSIIKINDIRLVIIVTSPPKKISIGFFLPIDILYQKN